MKVCKDCSMGKPLDEYYLVRGNPMGHCKSCHIERMRLRDAANPEDRKQRNRAAALKRYGMSVEEYDQMLADQGGVCLICGREPWGRSFPVDHDHGTGQVRGILCNPCNSGMGRFEDDPDRLLAAAAYLIQSKTQHQVQ